MLFRPALSPNGTLSAGFNPATSFVAPESAAPWTGLVGSWPHPPVNLVVTAPSPTRYPGVLVTPPAAESKEAPRNEAAAPPLFQSKRNYELWKSTEHLFSYVIGNTLSGVAHYYYRVVNADLKSVFLFNPEHPVGKAFADFFVPSDMRGKLGEPDVNTLLTERANVFDNWASGIKMVFQFPNLAMNTLMALRTKNNRPLVLASVGNTFKSFTYLTEKAMIISAGALYNSGERSVSILGHQMSTLNMLTVQHAAIILGAIVFTPLAFPFLISETKKEGGVGGIFMESLNAIGAAAGNVLMSGATLYLFFQNQNAGGDYDTSFRILKQSFEFRDTLLYVNLGISLLVSGIGLVGHALRYRKAVAEKDRDRKLITIPLMASAVCSIIGAPFIANPATLPLAAFLYAASSAFFISSMVIKHREYLGGMAASLSARIFGGGKAASPA